MMKAVLIGAIVHEVCKVRVECEVELHFSGSGGWGEPLGEESQMVAGSGNSFV